MVSIFCRVHATKSFVRKFRISQIDGQSKNLKPNILIDINQNVKNIFKRKH